jgi:hypothetical protein
MPMLTSCTWYHHRTSATGCYERPFQGNTDPGHPLIVPTGLTPPDTRSGVKIPALNESEQPRPKSASCLDMPPSFAGGEAETVRIRTAPTPAEPLTVPAVPAEPQLQPQLPAPPQQQLPPVLPPLPLPPIPPPPQLQAQPQ